MALFETLKYRVVKKDKSIEIREYQDYYLPARPRQLISAKISDLWLCLIIFLVKMIVSNKSR